MKANGINDVIGVICAFGNIGANGDSLLLLASLTSLASMVPMGALVIHWLYLVILGNS